MKKKVISPFFLEEPVVTDDTFLDMMENSVLCDVPMGTVFQLDGAPPHFSHCVHAFLDWQFSDIWIGRGGPIPDPHLLWKFYSAGLQNKLFIAKSCKM